LSDVELRALWLACESDDPFARAVRLMVLTGARRNEVSRMQWSEIDEGRRLWTIPSERSKNGRSHVIPLSTQAWALIQAAPRFVDRDYVLSADSRGPIAGWAKAKKRLSIKAGLAEKSWRLHDLRRSFAVGLQRLGVSVPVIERALGHALKGILAVYQIHDYADEVQIAMQRQANRVEQIVTGEPAKVVKLRRR
jgi:integrase